MQAKRWSRLLFLLVSVTLLAAYTAANALDDQPAPTGESQQSDIAAQSRSLDVYHEGPGSMARVVDKYQSPAAGTRRLRVSTETERWWVTADGVKLAFSRTAVADAPEYELSFAVPNGTATLQVRYYGRDVALAFDGQWYLYLDHIWGPATVTFHLPADASIVRFDATYATVVDSHTLRFTIPSGTAHLPVVVYTTTSTPELYDRIATPRFDLRLPDAYGAYDEFTASLLENTYALYGSYTGQDVNQIADHTRYEYFYPPGPWGWYGNLDIQCWGGLTVRGGPSCVNARLIPWTGMSSRSANWMIGLTLHELANGWWLLLYPSYWTDPTVPWWISNEGHSGFLRAEASLDLGYCTAAQLEHQSHYQEYLSCFNNAPGSFPCATEILLVSLQEKYGWAPFRAIYAGIQGGTLNFSGLNDAEKDSRMIRFLSLEVGENLIPFFAQHKIYASDEVADELSSLPIASVPVLSNLTCRAQKLFVTPDELEFGGAGEAELYIGGTSDWTYRVEPAVEWLTVTRDGDLPFATLHVTADDTGLDMGNYETVVVLEGAGLVNSPLSVPVTMTIDAGDPLEPNDTFETATPIGADKDIAATISPAGDVDFYRFQVVAGDEIYAFLAPSEGSKYQPAIKLFDSARNEVDDGTNYIGHQATAAGVYYLRVVDSRHPNVGGGQYGYNLNLDIEPLDDWEPNDTRANASPIGYHRWRNAYISPAGDTDMFTFTGRAGQQIIAKTITGEYYPDSPLDTVLALLDKDGNQLVANDDFDGGPDSRLTATLPADGAYYLRVREKRHPNAGGVAFGYWLSLDLVDRHEPNDTPARAAPIAYGDRIEAVITEPCEDIDYYRFTGRAGDPVEVIVRNDDLWYGVSPYLQLYAADGVTPIATSYYFTNKPGARLFHSLPADGRYYLRMEGVPEDEGGAGCEGVYELSLGLSIYVSAAGAGTAGGVAYADSDVLGYDLLGEKWQKFFDASDVELEDKLSDFVMLESSEMLVTLREPIAARGLEPQDVARFWSSELGEDTEGDLVDLSPIGIDGSDVGLTTAGEAIDALAVDGARRIVISTAGDCDAPGVGACADEDLLAFNPTRLGENTAGEWQLYFDGSDLGLGANDLVAVWLHRTTGDVYFALESAGTAAGLAVTPDDIVRCAGGSRGESTSCDNLAIVWSGTDRGLGGAALDAISLGWAYGPADRGWVEIEKITDPESDTAFNFSGDLGEFSLTHQNSRSFDELIARPYVVTELPAAGWRPAAATCDDPDGGSSFNSWTDELSIDVDLGEYVHCRFRNVRNVAPVAVADTFGVNVDTTLVVKAPGVVMNDIDPTQDRLTAALVTDVRHGRLALRADGSFTYTPTLGFLGEDTFTYRAADGELTSNVAAVTIRVIEPALYVPFVGR